MIDIAKFTMAHPGVRVAGVINSVMRDISNSGYLNYASRPRRRVVNIVEVVRTIDRETVHGRSRRTGQETTRTKSIDREIP